ncbi:AAA family ATPase [Candidatus Woesearchaeota archaeon]|nr:AAA family ATPase [Candidatus Woesearchaeota archaeon]
MWVKNCLIILRRLLPEIKLRDKNPIPKEVLDKLVVTPIDFEEALRLVRPSALREVLIEKPNTTWEQIGGLESIKEEIKEAVEWPLKYSANFKRMGIKPPRGVLLYGPPGTGKTLLAKAVANGSEANFILIKGPELLNMFVGESEKGVRKIFEKARQAAPTIIFFDEVDSIAHKRGMEFGEKVTERMVNTLLSEMDGLQELNDVLVIAATNRPDMIDPALLRPGRFDRVILIPVPDEKSRLEILKVHTKGMPIAKDVNINELSKGTNNYTGADIEALCREAAILALRKDKNAKEVKMDNFKDALKKVKNSVDSEDMEKYKRIEEDYLKTARGAAIKEKLSYLG